MQITVVCLGNICRSPIGESVLSQRIQAAGLSDVVKVDSAGTGNWHVGDGANPRSMTVLNEAGYDIDHVVRQIQPHWMDGIDLLLAMDVQNYLDLQSMVALSEASPRLHMYRHFDPELAHITEPNDALDVPDPYWSELDAFRDVLGMIECASDGLVEQLLREL